MAVIDDIQLATLDDTGNVPLEQLANAPGVGGGMSQAAADTRYVHQDGSGLPANVVKVTGTPSSGQALAWNGSAWAPATISGGGGSSTLAGNSDVTIASPALNQALIFNGSRWVNGAVAVTKAAVVASGVAPSDIAAAPVANPTFTGSVNVPAIAGTTDSSTQAAPTAFVQAVVAAATSAPTGAPVFLSPPVLS